MNLRYFGGECMVAGTNLVNEKAKKKAASP